jgi:hypothetical protein
MQLNYRKCQIDNQDLNIFLLLIWTLTQQINNGQKDLLLVFPIDLLGLIDWKKSLEMQLLEITTQDQLLQVE